jgi:hypothetical protein
MPADARNGATATHRTHPSTMHYSVTDPVNQGVEGWGQLEYRRGARPGDRFHKTG